MLYLEDFLELIENLPSELRDRFTDIRTLDLEVQNGLDVSEKSVDEFFKNLQSLSPNQIHSSFEKIREDYRKIVENADEKVNLATMMHDLVKRYLAKLDQEVGKFKIELEADSPGITEALEKKVKESEQITRLPRREKTRKRKRNSPIMNGSADPANYSSGINNCSINQSHLHHRHVSIVPHHNEAMSGVLSNSGNFKKSQSAPYRLAETSRSSTASSHQSTSRDKASTSTNATGGTSGSGGFLHSFTEQAESRHGRPRKLTSRVSEMLRDVIQKQEQRERLGSETSGAAGGYSTAVASMSHHHHNQQGASYQHHHHASSDQYYGNQYDSDQDVANNDAAELSDQSDQQRWCICNRVSFGAMVACDDKDCPFEWFHYECVGITQPPKGKWFCPHCTKRRK